MTCATYQYGVPFAMGSNNDFGMLIKKYAASQSETRYSPATIIAAENVPMFGHPNGDKICTSHIESLNQYIQMHMRRFTSLIAAQSKSIDQYIAMQNVFFGWYNFCRKLSTIRNTLAMECGISSHQSSVNNYGSFEGDKLNPYDPPELSAPPKSESDHVMRWSRAFSVGGIWFVLLITSPIIFACLWSLMSLFWDFLSGLAIH